MEEGWIKLYRSVMNKAYYKKDSERVHLWVHLLLKATHAGKEEMFGGKPIFCNAGQFTVGRKQLAGETGIHESKIERTLTYFEKTEQQIEQQKSSTNRLITILNWEEYQTTEQQTEQPSNNHRTTTEQPSNTLQECKERKNVNNDKKEELQSKDCPISDEKVLDEKPKRKSRANKVTPEVDKDTDLNKKAREAFEARYFRLFKEKYYWLAKDAGNMTRLLNALKYQREQKNLSNENNIEVVAALTAFLNEAVKDEWIVKNFSISILFSKFNEIVARAKAKEQERIKSTMNYGTK